MIFTLLRRAVLAGGATLVLVVLAGCGSSDGRTPSSSHAPPSSHPAVSGSPMSAAMFNDSDVTFTQMMIVHHRQAVEMSALVDGRAADSEVIDLAKKIRVAQDSEIAAMTGWLTAWGQPTAVAGGGHGSSHGGMPGMMSVEDMAKLKAASAAGFDRQFCTMMIAHHEGAITMAQEEIANGVNPQATALARQVVATQQAEIDAMYAMLDRL